MTFFESKMPAGWSWETISTRFRITKKPKGRVYSDFKTIPFVPMEAVPLNGREAVRFELRRPTDIASGTYFEKGDVLLSKITPSFENGKQGLGDNIPAPFGVASTEIIPLQAITPEANHRFLFFYLLHPEVRAALVGKMEGSTGRQRVPEGAVREFPIPMPPKPEQEKIAAVLWKVQRAIQLEEKLTATARELKQSAMRQLFTHGLRGEPQKETDSGLIPASWEMQPIRANAKLVAGGTPSRGIKEFWTAGTIPWVKTGEVDYCVITETEEKITPVGLENSAAKILPKGTLLIAMYGQGITRGKVAILGIDAATNQASAGIIPTTDKVLPMFLYYYLSFSYDRLRSFSHGAQQLNLNAELVGSFQVPLADPAEQKEIAIILQAVDRKISVHERKRAALSDLFQTLLNQLMTAEIRVDKLDIDTSEVTA